MAKAKVELNEEILKSFQPVHSVTLKAPINTIDWSSDGMIYVLCTLDGWIYFYDTHSSEAFRVIDNSRHGAQAVKFVYCQKNLYLLVAGSKVNLQSQYEICLWSLERNLFVKRFSTPSPVDKTDGILVHPTEESFIAICEDQKLRYFSVQKELPLLVLESAAAHMAASFDTEGFVFACALGRTNVNLFICQNLSELKSFDCSPCIEGGDAYIWHILFSPDSDYFVLTTNFGQILGFQALYGQMYCEYRRPLLLEQPLSRLLPIPIFTSNGRFLLCSAIEGGIDIWTLQGSWLFRLVVPNWTMPQRLYFNPGKLLMLSTFGKTLLFWLPPRALIETNDASLETTERER